MSGILIMQTWDVDVYSAHNCFCASFSLLHQAGRVEMCSVASLQVSINAMEILVMLCEKDAELIKRHITDSEFSEVPG